ncbi:MAG: ImmA/IrrE family metallo-endopeptidase [Planctomycetia bacterium]|nr:ImmA/IrrE family metallo-endopeptidase [Planctomycetia bacterium]
MLSAEAQLTPLPDRQLLLEFNPERADVRRNFSICHEIVHTFFTDCFEVVSQRKSNPTTYGPNSEIEQLCQIGAAELLMPTQDFLNDLAQVQFSMRSVRFLSDRYVASREAVLRRMIQLGDRPAAIVFLSRRLSPNERRKARTPPLIADLDDPAAKMRILYAVSSPAFPVFLPRHKSVPDDSCIYAASGIDDVTSQQETWDLEGFGRWRVEAMTLPVPLNAGEDTPAVVAIVLPD